jgi:uncharacterized protein YjbI with pentapeptide repeats
MNDSNQFDQPRSGLFAQKHSGLKTHLESDRQTIYKFFLKAVRTDSSEDVLEYFRKLFIFGDASNNTEVFEALYAIILNQDESFFRNTFKRCCYILINHWFASRKYKAIIKIVTLLDNIEKQPPSLSQIISCLRSWIVNFIRSQEYQELKVFTTLGRGGTIDWSQRYASYLLAPQYLDPKNPPEQREIARQLAKKLKLKFNLELAMYTARYDSPASADRRSSNPTNIDDRVIYLIKIALYKNITYSYKKYHHLFDKDAQEISIFDFKNGLCEYLMFSCSDRTALETLKVQLFPDFQKLHEDRHSDPLTFDQFLNLCRWLVDRLTTEDGRSPSPLFILLNVQSNPLTIVLILLKLVLICKYTRPHLEVAIAQLIHLYENLPKEECQWFINFLEIFQIIFAIYTENVRYNLVKVQDNTTSDPKEVNLKTYRVFSQLKGADLHDIDLNSADLHGDELSAADLRGANLSCADLGQADLSLAKLNGANLKGATLDTANLTVADLSDAYLKRASLKAADLSHADLQNADLSGANLANADLDAANLHSANLSGANLSGANLRSVNLSDANLHRANLSYTNLSHANLQRANLEEAQLRHAQLTDIHLEEANLQRADLSRADLSRADLREADLRNALLRHVKLDDTNLSHAHLQGANFFGTNLQGSRGLKPSSNIWSDVDKAPQSDKLA